MLRLLVLVYCLYLTGCAWPVYRPEPYDQNKIGFIRRGETTREDLTRILGQPQIRLEDDDFWIYGQSRMVIYDTMGLHTYEYQSLLVEFDNNAVKDFEVIEDKYGCWSVGICLVSGWPIGAFTDGPTYLDPERTVVISKRQDDKDAKQFKAESEQCAVYLYRTEDFFMGKEYGPPTTLGPALEEPLHYKGFLMVNVPEGSHDVIVAEERFSFACSSRDVVFIEIEVDVGWSKPEIEFRLPGEIEGKAEIMKRNLLLTW